MQQTAYAADERGREIEQAITLEILRSEDGARWSRSQLQERLKHIEPHAINDALGRLSRRDAIQIDGDAIEAQDSADRRHKLDLLSGVVVHVLVSAHPKVVALAEVARECERDLEWPDEREEIELALRWISGDELAHRQDHGWIASRPAVRAAELSF